MNTLRVAVSLAAFLAWAPAGDGQEKIFASKPKQAGSTIIPEDRLADWRPGITVGVPGGIPTDRKTLLDVTKLESGMLSPAIQTVAIDDVLEDLQRQFQDIAAARSLKLEVQPCGQSIRTDRILFRQLLQNLLNNALHELTAPGRLALRLLAAPEGSRIEVEDSGPGIAPEDLAHLFERFRRGKGAKGAGTGLGLAIAKKLVELHRGTLEVASEPGKGTRFTIRLPAD